MPRRKKGFYPVQLSENELYLIIRIIEDKTLYKNPVEFNAYNEIYRKLTELYKGDIKHEND